MEVSSLLLRTESKYLKPIEIEYNEYDQKYEVININKINKNYNNIEIVKQVFNGKIGLTYKDFVSHCRISIKETSYYIEKKIIPVWYAEKFIEKNGAFIQIVNN
jgi:hypothetical protein